jgi:hypothetical protein
MIIDKDKIYTFISRSFWDEMGISHKLLSQSFAEYLGAENRRIINRSEAISYISPIIEQLQKSLIEWMNNENTHIVVSKLYCIYNKCFIYYMSQRKQREALVQLNISDDDVIQSFEENKNISLNLLTSINLWLENSLLYQNDLTNVPKELPSNIDSDLLITLYLYGLLSRNLSLLSLSNAHNNLDLFYGIDITISSNEPIVTLIYHPVIYFNPLLSGNQKAFSVTTEQYKNASNSSFGKGFSKEYGVDFLLSLRIMRTFQLYLLENDNEKTILVPKDTFLNLIKDFTSDNVDSEKYFDAFVLTKDKIQSQLRKGEPIIWITGTNKYRHEIRPFLCLGNNNVFISYQALEQSIHIWLSYFANGGMIYTNSSDALTDAIETRNDELSKQLVGIIRNKLKSHYKSGFDEIDVDYERIFGKKDYNYGDFDLVFFAEDTNELFLIEAKFFSDSLNNSGMITDYYKLFKKKGYYYHCRKRYDLVLQNIDSLKAFIGVSNEIKAHFLFVSSKPLEIEFQDKDGIV